VDVVKEVRELKNQLAYAKNIGFFFGAGTSCALNVPNIAMLTTAVEGNLKGSHLANFQIIKTNLDKAAVATGRNTNIEDILNQIRRIRDITSDNADQDFIKVNGLAAKTLDKEICNEIYRVISESEGKADLTTPRRFFAWLNLLSREYCKEVFTTNYDLIIEKSLEASQIPYFDGFVGSYEPFFWQESVEQSTHKNDMTTNWIRLWKIHGSLSWFWREDSTTSSQKIIRVGKFDSATTTDRELVIYPSKEKYDSSRKQPFVAFFDRLKSFLSSGELLFIFSGYSFSDQHINDVVFNCLRQNNRLFCVALCFQDSEVEALHKLTASSYMNLNVFGPKKAIVNGTLGHWEFNKGDLKDTEKYESYWDETAATFKLGDFRQLVAFLIASSGRPDLLLDASKR
jgi:hypothetical protein